MPGPLHHSRSVVYRAKAELSNRLVIEDDLCKLWSQVCEALEEDAPASALPAPAEDMTGDLISLPIDKRTLPAASPHSLESTVASARTTGTKTSPWSLATGSAKHGGCLGIPQFSEFPEATSLDFPGTPGISSATADGNMSPSMVDAKLLCVKLEKLAKKRRPSRELYRGLFEAEPGTSRTTSKNRSSDTDSNGPATPLSVHSVSVPQGECPCPTVPWIAATPGLPSPSKLPWLQLSGTQFSMPSVRALEACAGDATQRPVASRSAQSTSRSKSALASSGLPPLPGAIGDSIAMHHTLRNLAMSSQAGRRYDRHDPDTARGQPTERWAFDLTQSRSHSWLAALERKRDLPQRSLSLSLPRKRSRFKRMLSCLWRFRHSKGT